MSERLRLQEEFSNQKPGLLKFAKTARLNTTVLQKRGIKKARKFSSDRRTGKLRSFESGFCEDIEENRKRLDKLKINEIFEFLLSREVSLHSFGFA